MGSFQNIIDGATAIKIDKNPIISQSVTRDQTVRQISRGGAVYRFSVSPNPAMKWEQYRWLVAGLEEGRLGSQTIQVNKTGHEWLFGYVGDLTPTQINALTFQYTSGQQALNARQVAVYGLPAIDSGATVFHAGNVIQSANSAFPYTVTDRVYRGSDSYVMVPIHRVCLDTPSNTQYDLKVGTEVTYRVVMTKMPSWTITGDRLISWDGNFEFMESLI